MCGPSLARTEPELAAVGSPFSPATLSPIADPDRPAMGGCTQVKASERRGFRAEGHVQPTRRWRHRSGPHRPAGRVRDCTTCGRSAQEPRSAGSSAFDDSDGPEPGDSSG